MYRRTDWDPLGLSTVRYLLVYCVSGCRAGLWRHGRLGTTSPGIPDVSISLHIPVEKIILDQSHKAAGGLTYDSYTE